jgi:hypothetical protein
MPTVIRIAAPISASFASSEKSRHSEKSGHGELVSIALFSGIGLLVSLVAILTGVQGVWY